MNDARNVIVVVVGRKGSGKSHLLGQYARHFPRRLILDFTGEHRREPGARFAWTLSETVTALQAARAAGRRWTVVAALAPADVPRLLPALMPVGRDTERGFSLAVGGMVIECGEVNEIAPNHNGIAAPVSSLFMLGRHHRLSILCAARRTTEMHNNVTSQADIICAFRQHQEADVKRIGELMGDRAVAALRQLAVHEHLRYYVDTGRLDRVRANGQAERLSEQ